MAETDVSGRLPAPPEPSRPKFSPSGNRGPRRPRGRRAPGGAGWPPRDRRPGGVDLHADLGVLSGGFLGVDVFFVISRFLITTLLLAERDRLVRIRLREFWLRRARRLLPALFLVLGRHHRDGSRLAPDEVARVRGDTLAALPT